MTESKPEKDSFTIIAGDFNTSFAIINRIRRLIKEEDLNTTTSQLDLIDIYGENTPP